MFKSLQVPYKYYKYSSTKYIILNTENFLRSYEIPNKEYSSKSNTDESKYFSNNNNINLSKQSFKRKLSQLK